MESERVLEEDDDHSSLTERKKHSHISAEATSYEEDNTICTNHGVHIENQHNVSGDEIPVSGDYIRVSGNLVTMPGMSREMPGVKPSSLDGTFDMLPGNNASTSGVSHIENETVDASGKRSMICGNQFDIIHAGKFDQSGIRSDPSGSNYLDPATVCNVRDETFNKELLQTVFPHYRTATKQDSQIDLDTLLPRKKSRLDSVNIADDGHPIGFNPSQASTSINQTSLYETKALRMMQNLSDTQRCLHKTSPLFSGQHQANQPGCSKTDPSNPNTIRSQSIALSERRIASEHQVAEARILATSRNNSLELPTIVSGNYTQIVGNYFNIMGNVIQQKPQEVDENAFVQSMANDIKEYYQNSFCKKPIYPWEPNEYVDLEKIYVPMTIDIKIPGVRPIKERVVNYADLFNEEQECKRFVLTGNPGQGKSSFCTKLAYDWCHKTVLPNIRLLFIIQLGLVDHKCNVEDAICSQLLSSDFDGSKIIEVIRKLGKTVMLVFDGLDEAPPDFMKHENVGNLINIMRYKDLRECRVLVTTRPWREHEITQFSAYKRLQLQKMSKSDVKAYVEKTFNQNPSDFMAMALGKLLLKYIETNKLLVDTSTPLVILLVSWFWIQTNGKRGIPDRISELYDQLIAVMHEGLQLPTLTQKTVIDRLGKIATDGLTPTKTKIVFTEDELKKSCGDENVNEARSMGIICKKGECLLQFFHKSGQEFCAGKYLAHHLDNLSLYLQDVKTVKNVLSVASVLTFASSSKPAAEMIVKKLVQIFKSIIRPQEYYGGKLTFDETQTIQPLIELCLECFFEAKFESEDGLNHIMRELFIQGNMLAYGIQSKAAISLAYYMQHCDPQDISNFTFRPIARFKSTGVIYGPIREIYNISLQNSKCLSSEKIHEIVDKVTASNPDIHKGNHSQAEVAAFIPAVQACDGLPSSDETNVMPIFCSFQYIKLKRLVMNNFELGDQFDCLLETMENGDMTFLLCLLVEASASKAEQITKLAMNLHKVPRLQVLSISRNNIEAGQSIPILAKSLHKCIDLQKLFVFNMQAPVEDMVILARHIPSQLTELGINGNEMSDEVAVCLINTLPNGLTRLSISMAGISDSKHRELLKTVHNRLADLENLTIFESAFSEDLVKHGGVTLTKCKNLQCLDLRSSCNDRVSNECAEVFLNGVQQETDLGVLKLYGMGFEMNVFQNLMKICRRKKLQELSLSRNILPADIQPEELDDYITLI